MTAATPPSLSVAIIGLGVGEQHIAGFEAHPEAAVVALCDIDERRLAEVAARHPGRALHTSDREILADPQIDVVSVASYDDAHHRQVVAALEAGKHVFVEKPLCQTRAQAQEIRRLLRSRPGLRLSSNLPLRASPRFRVLRELVQSGELGDLYYLEGDYQYGRLHKITRGWRGQLAFYSVLQGGAVHMVDLLLWLSGEEVVDVVALGHQGPSRGTQFRYPDVVAALLRLTSGAIAKMTTNFAGAHPHFHDVRLFGSRATFVNAAPDALLHRWDGDDVVTTAIDAPYPGIRKGDLIPSFVEAIVADGTPDVDEEDVFRTMSVVFAIEDAVGSGDRVAVEPL